MKTIKFFAVVACLCALQCVSAQSDNYISAMKETLGKLQTDKTGEAMQSTSAQFERIAQAEKIKWEPYYYASYVNVIRSFSESDGIKKDQLIDQAQILLDNAFKLKSDSSEMMVLQGFLYVAKLSVDAQSRGAEYSRKAHSCFQKAMIINPNNPRAYYLEGMTILNTPDFWGGGKIPAKPILTIAVSKFETFQPAGPFYPSWGKQQCASELAKCD